MPAGLLGTPIRRILRTTSSGMSCALGTVGSRTSGKRHLVLPRSPPSVRAVPLRLAEERKSL
eukprot:2842137-Pyramimonas_sp.AAC.1